MDEVKCRGAMEKVKVGVKGQSEKVRVRRCVARPYWFGCRVCGGGVRDRAYVCGHAGVGER